MTQCSVGFTKRIALFGAILLATACSGSQKDDSQGFTTSYPANDATAGRLLAQASFGATEEEIDRVKALGIDGWVDNQMTLDSGPQLEYLQATGASGSNSADRIAKWWHDAIDGEDQLRGRVAFALSEIFVVSDVQQTLGNAQLGLADYYDRLREHAFGNYRDLLGDITLHPVMGVYLSMMQNAKADPATNTRADENFAREVMQLFSIGLHDLNIDGTEILSGGNPIPSYTQADVREYARVFTGWGYGDTDRWDAPPASQFANFLIPMEAFPEYHDTGEKRLLNGVVVPAGLTAEEDLDIALDSLFNHPNVGPFISKQLIQRLVTSNPSPAYVGRVARRFNDNGSGVRGDLGAVVRAILLDDEARYGHERIEHFGKIREPILRLSHLWRAFDAQFADDEVNYTTNAPTLNGISSVFGQTPLGSASVFNFFHPDYAPLGEIRDLGLVAPEAEIYTENFVLTGHLFMNTYIHKFYKTDEGESGVQFLTYIYVQDQVTKAQEIEDWLDELDTVLLAQQMSPEMREILKEHMEALPDDSDGRVQRVLDGISLVMASPAYLVQK